MRARVLLIGVAIVSIAGTCSRPPPRAPEADDHRDGATALALDATERRAELSGTLAPGDGDTVDWITIALPAGPRRLAIDLRVDGPHLPAAIELYDGHGAIISHLDRRPGKTRSTARASTVAGGGQVFVRIADDTAASTIRYAFSIEDRGEAEPEPPPPPPPCDPANWDATNPSCASECNFAKPDVHAKACCKLIQPCAREAEMLAASRSGTGCAQRAHVTAPCAHVDTTRT